MRDTQYRERCATVRSLLSRWGRRNEAVKTKRNKKNGKEIKMQQKRKKRENETKMEQRRNKVRGDGRRKNKTGTGKKYRGKNQKDKER